MKYWKLILGIIIYLASLQVTAETVSLHTCKESNPRVAWKFSSALNQIYLVEEWSVDEELWKVVETSFSETGYSNGPMDRHGVRALSEGKLYRVSACASVEGTTCEHSPVVWSPALACANQRSEKNMKVLSVPTPMPQNNKAKLDFLGVSLELPEPSRVTQYNMNLAVAAALSFPSETPAPPMKKPDFISPEQADFVRVLLSNVYVRYEYARTGKLPDIEGTGIERFTEP